jgi:ArsR family transcriptional regulator
MRSSISFIRRGHARPLQITFKDRNFNNMNAADLISASAAASELMRSLSHPHRLLVLCALGSGEKSVAELRAELGVAQVPMSQQLMRLRSDGLVLARREGTTVYYRIARPEILSVVEAVHGAFCPPVVRRRGARVTPRSRRRAR